MIAARVRKRFTEHDWFAVGIELAIVGVGVFLGLQASNWNDARIERAKAHEYSQRLIADLRHNERDMARSGAYYSSVVRHATAALAALEQPRGVLGEDFLIDASQAGQVYLTRPKRFTYDAIVTAGDLDLLGDLGERIGTYYLLLDNMVVLTSQYPPYRERYRREVPYAVEKPIRDACSDINITEPGGGNRTILPSICHPGLDKAVIARGVARLRAAPELDRDLSRYVLFLNQTLNLLKAGGQRARVLREAIERADV